jgi:hypothetical protein
MTEEGRITNNWPHSTIAWRRRIRQVDFDDFELVPGNDNAGVSDARERPLSVS